MTIRVVVAAIVLPIVLVSFPRAAVAAQSQLAAEPRVVYDRSCEKKAMTTLAIDECAASELAQLQRQLMPVLSSASAHFGRGLVNAAQAKWLGFCDAECLMEASTSIGGSAHTYDVLFCEISLTVRRITDIREAISNIPH
jgi:uncharacterized protein YecT (DUF1311 family)